MTAETASNTALKTASYSKLNTWNQTNSSTPLTARGSSLARWKCVFVILVIITCIIFIGLGIGFGLSKMQNKVYFSSSLLDFVSTYDSAAVTSQSPQCSKIGRNILLKGGSAVDAAIAALVCESAYSPQSAGLGGGFVMIVYNHSTGSVQVIDARETAPGLAPQNMFVGNKGTAQKGPLAIAIPGEVRGYEMAHQLYGRLNWSELFTPTAEICRAGIPVSKYLAHILETKAQDTVLNDPNFGIVFGNNGTVKRQGDIVYCLRLANTLDAIAYKGADEFYTGAIGKALIRDLAALGAIITLKDLADYKVVVRAPAVFKMNSGVSIYSAPPPYSGHILGLLLTVLDNITHSSSDIVGVDEEIVFTHRFVEACKYVYAKRSEIGDPDFEAMSDLIKLLSSAEYAQMIQDGIRDNRTFNPEHYRINFTSPHDHGTAHVSVLAPNGDAVSATSTLNLWFGADVLSPSTGIILNNEMDDFSIPMSDNFYGLPPSEANFIKPGKRPASSMVPSIALDADGNPLYIFGGSGGSKIISATAYVYALYNFFNESLRGSLEASRVHHQLIPNEVQYEPGISMDVYEGLKMRGHDLARETFPSAVYFIHRRQDGSIIAGSDPRRGGMPAGF